jgi:Subtilase family
MKPHLFLNNPRGEQRKFNAQRNFEPEDVPEKEPAAYRPQKRRLLQAVGRLNIARAERLAARSLEVPQHIEYIKIDFYLVFNDNVPFKLQSRYLSQFGLVPVSLYNFNQSVLFALRDEEKFNAFLELLRQFYQSRDNVSPTNTPYAIMTLIDNFEFLASGSIIEGAPGEEVILSLVKPAEPIRAPFRAIYNALIEYVGDLPNAEVYTDDLSTVAITNISPEAIALIADNFDIIYRIQSLRVPAIAPDRSGSPQVTWNLEIEAPPDEAVFIGVLDNGVRPIDPLRNILVDMRLDLTNPGRPNAMRASHPHGTVVASLAATGLSFFQTDEHVLTADAYIVPMKILDFDAGYFNIYQICELIRRAAARGVRIFNLSVCGTGKLYNAAVSEYAYLLDQLTWELDILIFIATGNLSMEDIEEMERHRGTADGGLHDYPNHFYNPNKNSPQHVCEATNICIPAESHNNCTVGAIADNLVRRSPTGLTPFKELPAYYTRKWHLDYSQKVNGTDFSPKQINSNLNKPDIVMPGGDLLAARSKMQVLGFGDRGTDFFELDSGTSYAAPLAANLAAKIVRLYPALNMQSVKALLLNSAQQPLSSEFLNELVEDIKEEMAQERFHHTFATLTRGQKMQISGRLSSDRLYTKLVGYGLPDPEKALYSDKKTVTMLIQDSIAVDSHKVINLNLPRYLLRYNRSSYILRLKATLCYKFPPVWNNQLGYNPLHISFNFVRSLEKDDPVKTADIIADRDHRFNQDLTADAASPADAARAKQEAYGIKKKLESWSEDFFPPATKPFGNTQQLTLNINTDEIRKVGRQISIAIRCTCKKEIEREVLEMLLQSPHAFSIALNIEEKANDELGKYDLYDELEAINDLDAIGELEAEGDLEVGDEEE